MIASTTQLYPPASNHKVSHRGNRAKASKGARTALEQDAIYHHAHRTWYRLLQDQGAPQPPRRHNQVSHESRLVLFGDNTFLVHFGNKGASAVLSLISKADLKLVKHICVVVQNKRSLQDPQLPSDTERIKSDMEYRFIKNLLLNNDVELKTLEVRYNSAYHGSVEEVRGLVDATADSSDVPAGMTAALMCDDRGRQFVVTKESAIACGLFRSQACLEPLKLLAGRVRELSLAGDISQGYINKLISAIKPAVALSTYARKKRLANKLAGSHMEADRS